MTIKNIFLLAMLVFAPTLLYSMEEPTSSSSSVNPATSSLSTSDLVLAVAERAINRLGNLFEKPNLVPQKPISILQTPTTAVPKGQDVIIAQTHEVTKKLNRFLQDRNMTSNNVTTCNYHYADRNDRKKVKKVVKGYPMWFPKAKFQCQPKLMPDKTCKVILMASAVGNKKGNKNKKAKL